MNFLHILLIAVGLAMDALAVSIAEGIALRKVTGTHTLRVSLHFGAFQGAMPIVGWLAGTSLRSFIGAFDHWVAFILLSFIGGKMIVESFSIEDIRPLVRFRMLIALALVTSIDALAAGLSFSSLDAPILLPAAAIGVITFILSYIGVYLGARLSRVERLERYANLLGGVVLILIGVRILLEHLIKHI